MRSEAFKYFLAFRFYSGIGAHAKAREDECFDATPVSEIDSGALRGLVFSLLRPQSLRVGLSYAASPMLDLTRPAKRHF